jgi:hypothetical protein
MSLQSKIGLVIAIVLFVTYAFFPQDFRNENVVSRMALTLSILEDGTLEIDKFQDHTEDIAIYHGNYYSDKAPGMAFSALPSAALTRATRMRGGNDGATLRAERLTRNYQIIVYWSTLFTSGLMTAIAALALYFLALRTGASTAGAIFATLAYGLATPAWGWAGAFFGHAVAGACLFLGFAAVFYLVQGSLEGRRETLTAALAGALLTWGVVVEFTTLPAAAIIAGYGMVVAWRGESRRLMRLVLIAGVAALLSAIPLLVYNTLAFGSPLRVGYGSVPGFEGLRQGFFGLTYPQGDVLYRLIFPQYRGILWYAPILISVPFAFFALWRQAKFRGLALVLGLVPLYFLLMNASYFYWDGGGSTGPRHLTPSLAFLCLPLGILWSRAHETFKPVLLALLVLSFQIALVSASVDMSSPADYREPLFDYLMPSFLEGAILRPPFVRGLNGHMILVPLLLVWAVGYLLVRRLFVSINSTI